MRASGAPFPRRLTACLAATACLLVAELVLGHLSHCLTLLALTNHTVYNLLTLAFALASQRLDRSSSPSSGSRLKSTFGWARLEVVGAMFSLIFLFSLSFATSIECLQTLFHSGHLDTMHLSMPVFAVGCAHALVWVITFFLIGGYTYCQSCVIGKTSKGAVSLRMPSHKPQGEAITLDQMINMPLKYIFRDLAGCVILLLTAGTVHLVVEQDWDHQQKLIKYLDPSAALATIAVTVFSSVGIAKASCFILLETIPDELRTSDLRAEIMRTFPAVLGVHDMRVWCLVPGTIVVTMHAVFQNTNSYNSAISTVSQYLSAKGVSKFTIQPEFVDGPTSDAAAAVAGDAEEITALQTDQCLLKCKGRDGKICRGC